MNEWGVLLVLVVLDWACRGNLVKPLIKWNVSLAENTLATKALTKTIKDNETRNEKEHGEIFGQNLDEHDKRISCIEHQ